MNIEKKENEKMKKAYESPKAEQMVFDYAETVVASGTCSGSWEHWVDKTPTSGYDTCHERIDTVNGQTYTEV